MCLLGGPERRGQLEGTSKPAPQHLLKHWAPEHLLPPHTQPLFSPPPRLAIQMEENGILRDVLGSALRGKEEDFRMYHQTLGQVKGVFLQALRQQRANKQ